MNTWRVYLLRCCDGTLYCGITNDLDARVNAHNAGKGAKYTRGRLPVVPIAVSDTMMKRDALKLERVIKKQPKNRKVERLQQKQVMMIRPEEASERT